MSVDEEVARTGTSRDAADHQATVTTAHDGVLELATWEDEPTRYELGGEIARGGGGRVLAATDRRLAREIAIKLPLDHPGSLERLVHEARLLARLEHPAIVPVHDLVRVRDGTPGYVMKLLDGETLRSRIADRSFEDRIAYLPTVLAVVDAVAYAHHRGIIHRDLKPGNVIVGRFGETFLIDWGLARVVARAAGRVEPAPRGVPGAAAGEPITATGAVVGTPAYMAPEQAAGAPVDARADVYGLGAVLYHVLAGAPPYGGGSASAVVEQVRDGALAPIRSLEPRVPPELAAIVGKAMARRPEDRYATAHELGADLRRYQAGRLVAAHRYSVRARARRWVSRHRRPVAAAAVTVALAAALVQAWPDPHSARARCARSGDRVAAIWPATARDPVVGRIRASGEPGAAVIAQTVDRGFDRYARQLAAARVDACEATAVRGEQSEELLDRRMSCLDHRLDDLRAAIDGFDAIQRGELEKLVRTVEGLPPIAPCGDADLLRERVGLPAELGPRLRVLTLRRVEAIAEAERKAGRYARALALSEAVLRAPETARFAPLAASAGHNLGATLTALGRPRDATTALRDALGHAERGRDDAVRGEIWMQLAHAEEVDRPDRAQQAAELAGLIAGRIGSAELDAYHLSMLGRLRAHQGELVESLALRRRALARWQAIGHDDLVLADLVGGLGGALLEIRKLDDAEREVRRALALHEALLGADHPKVATGLVNLANILVTSNRSDDALAACARATDILKRAGLARTLNMFIVDNIRGLALTNSRAYDAARTHLQRQLADAEAALGPSHRIVGATLNNLASNEARAGHPEAALAWFRKALAWKEATLGPDHIDTANARSGIAQSLLDLRQPAQAIPLLVRALPVQVAQRGPASEDATYSRWSLAKAYLAVGRIGEALALAEQIQSYFRDDVHLDERGLVRLLLARALLAAGRDRPRAIALAEAARADFVASKVADDLLSEVDGVLARARR